MDGISNEVGTAMYEFLQKNYGIASVTDLDKKIADLVKKGEERQNRGNRFSISTMARGLAAREGKVIAPKNPRAGWTDTRESDINYVKALVTGSTPGSYLVPVIQANEIIEYLNSGGVARSMGSRMWPMAGIDKLDVPTALATPTWVWMAQNSVQTPTDPNLGQMAFALKERRALVAVPNQLLAVSVPAFDAMLAELMGAGAAEHEDTAMFAASTVSGGPTAMKSAASIGTVNTSGSGNGGNLAYSDILSVLATASAAKAKPPFVWVFSPRTFYQRVLGLIDTSSRPIVIPTLSQGLYQAPGVGGIQPVANLMGYPVFVSPAIPENETLGSGSAQSHAVFTNPKYVHIAEDNNIEIAISTERFFDANQTAIRGVQHEDFGFAPPAGITLLLGIN